MGKKEILKFFMLVLAILVIIALFKYTQQDVVEEDLISESTEILTKPEEKEIEIPEVLAVPQKEYDKFYTVPAYLWPKITIGKTVTAVIVYLFLLFGVAAYFIGHNAGGNLTKGKIFGSIGTATLVGLFGRSFIIYLEINIYNFLNTIFPDNTLIAGTIADLIVYLLWTPFIAGISVYFYETFTVTAEEAHPTK